MMTAITRASFRLPVPALALGLALYSSLFPAIASAQVAAQRTLSVTGVGEVAVETTIARVRLGVEARGTTAAAVQAAVAQRSSAIIDLLRSRAVERLQTTGIRLQPDYGVEDRQRRLVGYVGSNRVAFRVPISQAGDLIDAALTAGATQIDGVNFLASEAALAAAEQAALRAATADARQQAEIVLDSLGFSAREIASIQINPQSVPPGLRQNALLTDSTVATPIVGGEQVVRASVSLEIEY